MPHDDTAPPRFVCIAATDQAPDELEEQLLELGCRLLWSADGDRPPIRRRWCVDYVGDRFRLSPRECEILALVFSDVQSSVIAVRLGITVRTVKTHLEHIFEKTGTHSRQQLAGLIMDPAET